MSIYPNFRSTTSAKTSFNTSSNEDGAATIQLDLSSYVRSSSAVFTNTVFLNKSHLNFNGLIQKSAFTENEKNTVADSKSKLSKINYDNDTTNIEGELDLTLADVKVSDNSFTISKVQTLASELDKIYENLAFINSNDTDITAIQQLNITQNDRLDDIDSLNLSQNDRHDATELLNTEQDARLNLIETEQEVQNGVLDAHDLRIITTEGYITDILANGAAIQQTNGTVETHNLLFLAYKTSNDLALGFSNTNIASNTFSISQLSDRLNITEQSTIANASAIESTNNVVYDLGSRMVIEETATTGQQSQLDTLTSLTSSHTSDILTQNGLVNTLLATQSALSATSQFHTNSIASNETSIGTKHPLITSSARLDVGKIGNGDVSSAKLSSLNTIRTDVPIQSQLDTLTSNLGQLNSLQNIDLQNIPVMEANISTLLSNDTAHDNEISALQASSDTSTVGILSLVNKDLLHTNTMTELQAADVVLEASIALKADIISLSNTLDSSLIVDGVNGSLDSILAMLDENINTLSVSKQDVLSGVNKLNSLYIDMSTTSLQYCDITAPLKSQLTAITNSISTLQNLQNGDVSSFETIQDNFDSLELLKLNKTVYDETIVPQITSILSAISTLQSLQDGDITSFTTIQNSITNLTNTKQNVLNSGNKLSSDFLDVSGSSLQWCDTSSSISALITAGVTAQTAGVAAQDIVNSAQTTTNTSVANTLSAQATTNTSNAAILSGLSAYDVAQTENNITVNSLISTLNTNVSSLVNKDIELETDLNALTTDIQYNTNFRENGVFYDYRITTNANDIVDLQTNTSTNANDIGDLQTNTSTNTTNIDKNAQDIQYNTNFRENGVFYDYRITTNANSIVGLQTNIDNIKSKIEPFALTTNYDDTINKITHTYDETNLYVNPLDDNLLLDFHLTIPNVTNGNNYKQILYINCLEFKSYVNKILINDTEYEIKHKDSEVINLAPIAGYSMIKQELNLSYIGDNWIIMSETGLYFNSESNTQFDETPPVIILLGDANTTIEINESYSDAGATCEDIIDGNISDDIVITGDTVDNTTLGTYTLYYNITDNAGNTATQRIRVVNVIDSTNPVVVLIGDAELEVIENGTYSESGATVSDNSNETLSITIGGSVNTAVLGDYVVTYTATDSTGNTHQISRLVRVVTVPLTLLWSNPSINIFDYVSVFNNINSSSDKTIYNYTINGHSDYWVNGAYEIGCSTYRAGPNTTLTSIFGSTLYGGGNELYYESSQTRLYFNDNTLGNIGPRSDVPYDTSGNHVSTTAGVHTLFFSTVVSGTTYYGEFIDATFPFKLKVSKFYMDTIETRLNLIPKQMIICGSNNDGATYDYIATIGDNSTSPLVYDVAVTSSYAYKKIRIICTKSSSRRRFFLQFYKLYGNIYE